MLKHFKLDTMTHQIKIQHITTASSHHSVKSKTGKLREALMVTTVQLLVKVLQLARAFCFQRKEKGNNTWSSEMKLNWHKLPICIGTNLKVPNIWWVHPASLFLAGFQSCFGNVSEIPAYKVLQYVFQGKTTLYRTLLIHHVHQCSPWFTYHANQAGLSWWHMAMFLPKPESTTHSKISKAPPPILWRFAVIAPISARAGLCFDATKPKTPWQNTSCLSSHVCQWINNMKSPVLQLYTWGMHHQENHGHCSKSSEQPQQVVSDNNCYGIRLLMR